MPMPEGIPVIDTFLDPPRDNPDFWREFYAKSFRTETENIKHPAATLFKESYDAPQSDDPIGDTLRYMDKFNVEKAVTRLEVDQPEWAEAVLRHPDRFVGQLAIDPNEGMKAVRDITKAHELYGIIGCGFMPSGRFPPVPINDKRAYPIYAKCVELDIAVFVCAGVPGPQFPYEAQYVGLVDEVCYFFPELRMILRHGCEPWTDLAVKLLLKWPNLYYSTSAFAPKYYPKDIVEYANTRGADKIIYAGYYPYGVSLERVFSELPDVPFRDHVWPKFLRENAIRALKLEK